MKRITEITKRDILDLFRNGITIDNWIESTQHNYCYFGRMEEIDFLSRIYNLDAMPSTDSRYQNARGDIIQHTINNNDYPFCWVFEDERFQLQNSSDEIYLRFISEIFHPVVRDEKGCWKKFLDAVNELLRNDGYEIYPTSKISNRDVYGWRIYNPQENDMFIPFSQRNAKALKDKHIKLSIPLSVREQLYELINRNDEVFNETDNTGWNYNVATTQLCFSDVKFFYIPKCYNKQKQYVETDNIQNFMTSGMPAHVFDIIEFFNRHTSVRDFTAQVNVILQLNDLSYKFDECGKIVGTLEIKLALDAVQEVGLRELLQEAARYYDVGNKNIAVEKLWDSFERLKTYYSPIGLDKKKSITKIIKDMSNGSDDFATLVEIEFNQLTSIGNNYRIRHHETTKIDIVDDRHYDYFYKRCLSLLSIAIEYLK